MIKALSFRALCTVLASGIAISFTGSIASAESALDRIKENKKLVVGTNESQVPYSYIDSSGKWTGWELNLNYALHDIIQKKLGFDLAFEVKPVTPQTRIPMVVNGSLDWVLGTTGQTVDREEVVDFSLVTNAVCVKKLVPADSEIRATADLAGKRVGVTSGSVEERLLTSMNQSGELNPPAQIVTFDKHTSGFIALGQGKTDAHVTLDDALIGLKVKAPNPDEWDVRGPDIFCINQGIILPENDSDWRDMVNQALCYFIVTGGYDKLYAEWFLGDAPKAGYQREQSQSLRDVIRGQCPYGSEAFLAAKN